MAAATPEPLKTPVAAAFVSPGNEEEHSRWYVFYSETQKREYYFNPDSGVSTWVLPAGGRRFTDPRMIETNPGFTPIGLGRFSFDMFDDDDEASVHSEDGGWKEKSVMKANMIVLAMSLVGIFLSVAYSAFNVGGLLASVAGTLDSVQKNVATSNAMKLQFELQRKAEAERKSALYYPSWMNVLNDPSILFSFYDDGNSAAEQNTQQKTAHKQLLDNSNHALYFPSWWNVLENANDPSRDVELDQLVHNLVSSLEMADGLLNKIVIDAQQAGMELREAGISVPGDPEAS